MREGTYHSFLLLLELQMQIGGRHGTRMADWTGTRYQPRRLAQR